MKNYRIILTSVLFTALFGCTNPDKYEAPNLDGTCADLTPNVTVQQITSAANAATTAYTDNGVAGDDFIEAYVTSSDEGGNFYKAISFVSTDNSVGFSMPINDYNLYTAYEPGRKVYINMKGRYFAQIDGGTVIGSLYNNNTPADSGDDEVGRISGVEYKGIITASCSKTNEDDLVIHLSSVAEAQNDAYLNKLIEFDGVQFADSDISSTYFDASNQIGGATNHILMDQSGNTTTLRVSSYATFAYKNRPTGSGKVRGVMTRYRDFFQFMVRTERDLDMTGARFKPLISESFDGGFNGGWINYSKSGSQVWLASTTYGNPGACAKMSGFASSVSNANEDWLITPDQNLSGLNGATLTFDTATKFTGNALTVLISNNYTGIGDPTVANWTPIIGTLSPINGNYVWTSSGPININAYTGPGNNKVYVAFKYTSTASESATWEVDNVKITPN